MWCYVFYFANEIIGKHTFRLLSASFPRTDYGFRSTNTSAVYVSVFSSDYPPKVDVSLRSPEGAWCTPAVLLQIRDYASE